MTFTWARDVVPFLFPTALYRQRVAVRRSVAARRAAVHAAWPQWIAAGRGDDALPRAAACESPHRDGCRAKTFKRTGTSPCLRIREER